MDVITVLKYLVGGSALGIIVTVLLQAKSGGLGAVFGGGGGGETYRSRRGMEAVLHNGTIILAIVFATASLGIAILSV